MLFHRLLVLAMITATVAAEVATAPVVVVASEDADWQATARQLAASPYGALWRDPKLAPARARLAALVEERIAGSGIGIAELVDDLAAMRTDVLVGGAEAGSRFAIRLPRTAPKVLAALDGLPAETVKAMGSVRWARVDDWLVFGMDAPPTLPAAIGGVSGASRSLIDLDALAVLPDAAGPVAALAAFGASRFEVASAFTADGSRDEGTITGAAGRRLPLADLDAAALACFPADALSIVALGIDGPALDAAVTASAQAAPAFASAVAEAERELAAAGMGDLRALLRASGGTCAYAVTPGSPFPAISLLLPASPELDRVAEALAERAGVDISQARTAAIALPLPPQMPMLLQARRTATHWLVSSDAQVIDRAASPGAGGFDLAARCGDLPQGRAPRAIAWQDNAALTRLAQGMLGMAMGELAKGGAQQKQDAQLAHTALGVIAGHLPSSLTVIVDDGGATRIRARNGVMQMSMVAMTAGALLPAIAATRNAARKSKSGNQMRQLCLACLVSANEQDGAWPKSLAAMLADPAMEGQIGEHLLRAPNPPHTPYLYVRPDPAADSDQPVLVEDPACNGGKGSMVAYADGHVSFVEGDAVWREAQRLAVLPHAATDGISREDWSTLLPIVPPAE